MDQVEAQGAAALVWVGKLAPPQMQARTAARKELLTRLQAHRHMALALVIASPGFGKTTLLTQWHAALQHQAVPEPVAWLSLDEADRDAHRFLTSTILALETAGLDVAALWHQAQAEAADADPQRTVSALLQVLERSGRRTTLMLDDYHRAACPAVDEIVLTLLERASAWLQLVVASRTRPHWQLSTLKARGLLHEVYAGDLALSLSEATEIFGTEIDRSALSVVHSRTEGWAVAMQLARLWLAGGDGSFHGLQAFSGRAGEVADYLAEQIVDALPAECRDFLVETSLLERFNAELADAARGRDDSAAILARLLPFEALLIPLDARRSWFRYHLLLADFLGARLEPRRAQQVHRAAALWLASRSDWHSAVTHALQAHDTPLAVDLVGRMGGWELVLRRGIQYTQGLLKLFDDLARRTEPKLLLMQAYLHAKLGDEALAMELLRLAHVAVKAQPTLQRDYDVIEGLVHGYLDRLEDPDRWPTDAKSAQERLPDDPLGQATLLCVGAVASLRVGRMDAAMEAAHAARARMQLVASPLGENYCLLHLAQALSATGQLDASRMCVDEALKLAEANFGTDSSLKALAGCFKAQHLYWQGQWPEAMAWLSEGQETLRHIDGWLDMFAATAEVAWRIALRQEGLERALAVLDEHAQLARRRSLQRLSSLVQAWRVDLLAQCGLVAQAQQEAAAASLEAQLPLPGQGVIETGLPWRLLEAGTLALARLRMAAGAASTACVLLERSAQVLRSAKLLLPAWRLELTCLMAVRRRDEQVPAEAVHGALAPLLRHDLSGLLLEAGPAVLQLLHRLDPVPPQALAIVPQLRGWQTHPPRQRSPLSAKENEVLQLLVAGQPNKSIARALDISENTVKFHLKQIFQKLGVESRAAAIAAALQQGFATLRPTVPEPPDSRGT